MRVEFPRNVVLGSNSYFGIDCKIYASELSQIKIGSNVTFNSNVMINARGIGKISIGKNVLIGPNVVIRSSNHNYENYHIPIIGGNVSLYNSTNNKNIKPSVMLVVIAAI